MEAQLRANDHKPGWKGEDCWPLMYRMREETLELHEVLMPGSSVSAKPKRTRGSELYKSQTKAPAT